MLKISAGMMELADVLDSKSSGSDTVRVRPPPPAPNKSRVNFVHSAFVYYHAMGRTPQMRKHLVMFAAVNFVS